MIGEASSSGGPTVQPREDRTTMGGMEALGGHVGGQGILADTSADPSSLLKPGGNQLLW